MRNKRAVITIVSLLLSGEMFLDAQNYSSMEAEKPEHNADTTVPVHITGSALFGSVYPALMNPFMLGVQGVFETPVQWAARINALTRTMLWNRSATAFI